MLESLLHIEDVRKAKSIDFAVVFVTTRAEVDAAVTLIERKAAGDVVLIRSIRGWAGIAMTA